MSDFMFNERAILIISISSISRCLDVILIAPMDIGDRHGAIFSKHGFYMIIINGYICRSEKKQQIVESAFGTSIFPGRDDQRTSSRPRPAKRIGSGPYLWVSTTRVKEPGGDGLSSHTAFVECKCLSEISPLRTMLIAT